MRDILALKYCSDCNDQVTFLDRLFHDDPELCSKCYYEFIISIREKVEVNAVTSQQEWPDAVKGYNKE